MTEHTRPMTPITPTFGSVLPIDLFFKLKNLKQTQIVQHFLGHKIPQAPLSLDDAVIVGLDIEWLDVGSTKYVNELGFSVIDTRDITPNSGPWDVLNTMKTYHLRIKEYAHMTNTHLCGGRPDKFQFGHTQFVDKNQVAPFVHDMFSYTKHDSPLAQCKNPVCLIKRPVIFLGHAVDNDIDVLKEHFDIDLGALSSIVTTIDSQVMAEEACIRSTKGRLISLKDLIARFGLEEEFLHTAGNDIAYTAIAAFLTAAQTLAPDAPSISVEATASLNSLKLKELKALSTTTPLPMIGIPVFCVRCDSTAHMVENCDADVSCEKCATKGDHNSAKCIKKQVVVPCLDCTVDPVRYKDSYYHEEKDCPFAPKQP